MADISSMLVLLFALFTVVLADYTIDDADSTVRYTPATTGIWASLSPTTPNNLSTGNSTSIIVDYGRFHNGTSTYGRCTTTQACQIIIPFTGSGITIYADQFWGLYANFTVSIDNRAAPPPNLIEPPPHASPVIYNVTLYDVQSLPLSSHTLTMTLMDWAGNGYSAILFDYAYVNETSSPTTPLTGSSIPLSRSTLAKTGLPTSTSSAISYLEHKPRSVVGIVVGITLGTVLTLTAASLASCLIYNRRKRSGQSADLPVESFIVDPPFSYADMPITVTVQDTTSTPSGMTSVPSNTDFLSLKDRMAARVPADVSASTSWPPPTNTPNILTRVDEEKTELAQELHYPYSSDPGPVGETKAKSADPTPPPYREL